MSNGADVHDPDARRSGAVWFRSPSSTLTRFGRSFFLLLACVYFAFNYGALPGFLDLKKYAAGLERTPYQYRVLPMFIFRVLAASSLMNKVRSHLPAFRNDAYQFIVILIALTFMLGAVCVTRLTISRLTGDETYGFWASLMMVFMGVIQLATPAGLAYTFPYDVPALFFFSLGMYLIIRGRLWAFYLLFPVAVLNRETACFLTVFLAIWEWVRLSKAGSGVRARLLKIAPHVVVQAIVWIAIKVILLKIFRNNPVDGGDKQRMGMFIMQLPFNLRELVKPQQWPFLLSVCGFTLPFLYVQRRWIRCDGIFYACAIILPIYFVGMMIVGIIVEVRVFTEWIALVTPALALIVYNRFRPIPETASN